MEALKKICLFGGSFDPIHKRHVQMAIDAQKQFSFEKIIFIPTNNPPHKKRDLTSISHRIRMIELAICNYRYMEVSNIEAYRSNNAYTYDTVQYFRRKYPGAEIYCIIGEDSLAYLDSWYKAKELLQLVKFVVCSRFGDFSKKAIELTEQGAKVYSLTTKALDISSTQIRNDIGQGIESSSLDIPVLEYIYCCNLYSAKILPPIFIEYVLKLSTLINQKRLAHSLSVAYTARKLACIHGLDEILASTAGLLHDCAKAMPIATMQEIANNNHLLLDTGTFNTSLIHAPIGAEIVKHFFGVDNTDVYEAVAYHTTGMPGMSELSKCVFLADKIEPTRSAYAMLNEIREFAKIDLTKAMLLSIKSTKDYLQTLNKTLHVNTIRLLETIESKVKKGNENGR
ncbi:MAG: nicotinate (nicotinamide) nucleotide adenylyltransferase [Eubacteriales bacterium]|nr:nicotinate (nicotinamide) nucleotide adenylyltransferase [Eubacteriales bacterium]